MQLRLSHAIIATLLVAGCSGSTTPPASDTDATGTIAPNFSANLHRQAAAMARTDQQRQVVALAGTIDGTVADARVSESTLEPLRQIVQESAPAEIRALAADALGRAMDPDSMPMLLDAMDDPNPLVRRSAGAAVEKLVGLGRAFDPEAPLQQRQQVIAHYRQFWIMARQDAWYSVLKYPGKKDDLRRQARKRRMP